MDRHYLIFQRAQCDQKVTKNISSASEKFSYLILNKQINTKYIEKSQFINLGKLLNTTFLLISFFPEASANVLIRHKHSNRSDAKRKELQSKCRSINYKYKQTFECNMYVTLVLWQETQG